MWGLPGVILSWMHWDAYKTIKATVLPNKLVWTWGNLSIKNPEALGFQWLTSKNISLNLWLLWNHVAISVASFHASLDSKPPQEFPKRLWNCWAINDLLDWLRFFNAGWLYHKRKKKCLNSQVLLQSSKILPQNYLLFVYNILLPLAF